MFRTLSARTVHGGQLGRCQDLQQGPCFQLALHAQGHRKTKEMAPFPSTVDSDQRYTWLTQAQQ